MQGPELHWGLHDSLLVHDCMYRLYRMYVMSRTCDMDSSASLVVFDARLVAHKPELQHICARRCASSM